MRGMHFEAILVDSQAQMFSLTVLRTQVSPSSLLPRSALPLLLPTTVKECLEISPYLYTTAFTVRC